MAEMKMGGVPCWGKQDTSREVRPPKGNDGRDDVQGPVGVEDGLREVLPPGAQELICLAAEAELAELLAQHMGQPDAKGRAAVARNGYLSEREMRIGMGANRVRVPRVRSRTETSVPFHFRLTQACVRRASAWMRRCPR